MSKGTIDTDEQQATKMGKLNVTRWTVRVNCLKKIIDNFEPLLQLWMERLEEKLDAETKSRIIGCKKQMDSFVFCFGLQLGRKLYVHTDNPSKTMQQEKMSAIKGKSLADLTVQTLEGICNDCDYNLSTKVLRNYLAKSRLSQNRPYRENGTRQITVSFSLSRVTNLKNLIIQKLYMHISRQSTMKQLIPLSIRFRTGLKNLDSKCLVLLSSYS